MRTNDIEKLFAETQGTQRQFANGNQWLYGSFEDALGVARVVFMRCTQKWNPKRGVKFNSYLTHALRRRFINDLIASKRNMRKGITVSLDALVEDGAPIEALSAPAPQRPVSELVEHTVNTMLAMRNNARKTRDRYPIEFRRVLELVSQGEPMREACRQVRPEDPYSLESAMEHRFYQMRQRQKETPGLRA